MESLFIELYLDEDVNVLIADLLRGRGFNAVTTRDEGQLQNSDAQQLAYAVSQKCALVTHNRADFEELAQQYQEDGLTHYGLILATRHRSYELVRRLIIILNHITADELVNQIRYI
jgi:predicted nuclease of predicted toxin-antitoxin system